MFVLPAIAGVAIGILSGLLGIGGGTVMVPIFRLAFGMSPVVSTATSLFAIIPTSISGAASHIRHKTCIVSLGVAAGLGVRDQVTSPTFNILLTSPAGPLPLYHFDLYRLDAAAELQDTGYYQTLDGDRASFVARRHTLPAALPYGYLAITTRDDHEGNRSVRTHAYGDRARRLLFVWAKDSKSRLMKCAGGTACATCICVPKGRPSGHGTCSPSLLPTHSSTPGWPCCLPRRV